MNPIKVGTVQALWRYPVKSMKGEALEEAYLHWHGLDGDRRHAFVEADNGSSFPWLTARRVPEMVGYTPRFTQPSDVVNSPIRVTTPGGRELPVDDPALRLELEGAAKRPIHLIHLGGGTYDSLPISLITRATVRHLGGFFGQELDMRRFRQNIIVDAAEAGAYLEERWLGSTLTFGDRADSARIFVARRIPRCQMVNIDPDTAERNGRVLRGILSAKDDCVGVYAQPQAVGTIRVGDAIYLSGR